MEQALHALATQIETHYGTLNGKYSTVHQRLTALVQILTRQKRISRGLAKAVSKALADYRSHRKLPDAEIEQILRRLGRELSKKQGTTPRGEFSLADEDFPELGPPKRHEMPKLALPEPALPEPATGAAETPQICTILNRNTRQQWFQDQTGMVHFGTCPPPATVPIIARGFVQNGTLVM